MLNDRRPLLEWTCDKIAMKDHARDVPDLRIPKTLWTGTDLRDLATAELPEHWVLKPNNRTGLIHFGQGRPEIAQLAKKTARWLVAKEAANFGEWAYSKARPTFLTEELIGTAGSPPTDYKFLVFEGNVAAIQVDVSRHSFHQRRIYLPDWSPLDVRYGPYPLPPVQPAPPRLERMLAIAAKLGSEFDFIRIDLYDTSDGIFFGEFTPYACSGLDRFVPESFDVDLGSRWTLPDLAVS